MIPTEQEVKLYKDFVIEKKNTSLLTEEDKFMLNFTRVERIASKLSIMNYMGNFFDALHLISPVSKSNELMRRDIIPIAIRLQFTQLNHEKNPFLFALDSIISANLFNHFRVNIGEVIEEIPKSA